MAKLVKESLNEESYQEQTPLEELQAEWSKHGVDVEVVEEAEGEDCGNYGYDDYVKYQAFSFSCSTDDEMDEKVSPLGLEVVTDEEGEIWAQYWYDASPIFSGDIYTLGSDPQPFFVASAEEIFDEAGVSEDEEDDMVPEYEWTNPDNEYFKSLEGKVHNNGQKYKWFEKDKRWGIDQVIK